MSPFLWILLIFVAIAVVRRLCRDDPMIGGRVACRNPNCPHTILPATAQRTGGMCMPCYQGRTANESGGAAGFAASGYQEPSDEIEVVTESGETVAPSKKPLAAEPIEPRPLKPLATAPAAAATPEQPIAWPDALATADSLATLCARTDAAGAAARRLLPFLQQPAGYEVTCLTRLADDCCVPVLVRGPQQTIAYHAYDGAWTPEATQAYGDWVSAVREAAGGTVECRIAADSLPTPLDTQAKQA
jgi:hypothetical protein